jgi:hypothetical protein
MEVLAFGHFVRGVADSYTKRNSRLHSKLASVVRMCSQSTVTQRPTFRMLLAHLSSLNGDGD